MIDELDLYRRSRVFNIPTFLSSPLVSKFVKMMRCSGDEYTVKYFKDVKTSFIRLWAGMPVVMENGPFRHNQPVGWAKGLYGYADSDKKKQQVLNLLMIYTTVVSRDVTIQQEQKFLSGVTSTHPGTPADILSAVSRTARRLVYKSPRIGNARPLILEQTSPSRRAPHASGKTYPENECVLESLSFSRQTSLGLDISGRFRDLFNQVEEGISFEDPFDRCDSIPYPNSVGCIGLIQEPGMKLRAVANPGRVYQQALKPLGQAIYGILPTLPWDCTFDQTAHIAPVILALKKGKMIHSVDLSGATDNFPFDLQLHVLRTIFRDHPHIDLFEIISKAPWFYRDSMIRWTKGQPLGLYPSFGSFALTHGLLLASLLGAKQWDNDFFVLGDDVIILDSGLHNKYREVLRTLGCPISEDKSISSNKLAEFAGKLITPNGVISGFKWRKVSDDSFLDVVTNLGPGMIPFLQPRQRRVIQKIMMIPEFLGGLGWNPQGIPLQDRVNYGLSVFDKEREVDLLMSYTKQLTSYHYYDPIKTAEVGPRYHLDSLDPQTFDQKALGLLLARIPALLRFYEISGKNLFIVDPDTGLPTIGAVGRTSLLDVLERRTA